MSPRVKRKKKFNRKNKAGSALMCITMNLDN